MGDVLEVAALGKLAQLDSGHTDVRGVPGRHVAMLLSSRFEEQLHQSHVQYSTKMVRFCNGELDAVAQPYYRGTFLQRGYGSGLCQAEARGGIAIGGPRLAVSPRVAGRSAPQGGSAGGAETSRQRTLPRDQRPPRGPPIAVSPPVSRILCRAGARRRPSIWAHRCRWARAVYPGRWTGRPVPA